MMFLNKFSSFYIVFFLLISSCTSLSPQKIPTDLRKRDALTYKKISHPYSTEDDEENEFFENRKIATDEDELFKQDTSKFPEEPQGQSFLVDQDHKVIPASLKSVVLIGDQGKDNQDQADVAQSIARTCAHRFSCDGGFLLGDNLYSEGMQNSEDKRMDDVFSKHYDILKIPFIVNLGNHDYGDHGNHWEKANYELAYAKKHVNFFLPQTYFIKETDLAVYVVLDTNRIFWNDEKSISRQAQMISEAQLIAKNKHKWFIVSGHHPMFSNSSHGNAGNYDRIVDKGGMISKLEIFHIASGAYIKNFIEKNVCGIADIYLSGHDHNIQLINGKSASEHLIQQGKKYKTCPTYFVLSGAGASIDEKNDTQRNPTDAVLFEPGFVQMSLSPNTITFDIIDREGQVRSTHNMTTKTY